jgi:16S rRNA (cytosine967-C5)-methyltransferase
VAAVLEGSTLERALESALPDLPERDRALCRELAAGCLRLFPRLDGLLGLLLDRPMRRRDIDVRALALIGLYQLSELRIPAHAAVSATVEGAAALGKRRAAGLLNALLRRYQREAETLAKELPDAARHATPAWLWSALGKDWPGERAAIAAASNERPPMTLRVNVRRLTRGQYRELLAGQELEADDGSLSPDALTLRTAVDVNRLPGFADGLCSVQDEAAQCAARLLAPAPRERILDACAAPGGKTGHLAELAPEATLTAMDSSEQRLERVRENLDRLDLPARLLCGDATAPPAALERCGFDAILADVPCSATGVIRRHPDIKVLRRASDIAAFATQQGKILDGLWPLLSDGGRLLYVTCSILAEENERVVEAFLARRADATELQLELGGSHHRRHGLQLLPDARGPDGLFFALLGKKGTAAGSTPRGSFAG